MFGSRGQAAGGALRGMSAAQIVTADVEVLARAVLRDLRERARYGDTSVNTWSAAMRRGYAKDKEVMKCLSEALGWLRARTFVCDDLSVMAEGSWLMVTRAGRAWLDGPIAG